MSFSFLSHILFIVNNVDALHPALEHYVKLRDFTSVPSRFEWENLFENLLIGKEDRSIVGIVSNKDDFLGQTIVFGRDLDDITEILSFLRTSHLQ